MKKMVWLLFGAALGIFILTAGIFLSRQGMPVPVLMYHHFVEEGPTYGDTVVSAQRFEEQIRALKEAGYTAISLNQLCDYVDRKKNLPAKPILITMDDGYTSNLTIAAPILQHYHMNATVFVIGIDVGETTYPHSGEPLDPPRFSWQEVRPWMDQGVIEVQSHTYDMHQRANYGFSGRDGVLPLKGETDADYRFALKEDFSRAKEGLKKGLDVKMTALAFPFGLNTRQAVEELEELGVRVTLTTDYGCPRVVPGRKRSIQRMERWGINDAVTGKDLLDGLKKLELKSTAQLF